MKMKSISDKAPALAIAITAIAWGSGATTASATEPCGDFGECKTLIEINSSDGDIGFHFLMDGDDLNSASLHDPNGAKVFQDMAKGPLKEQKLTETFAESAEPLCWDSPDAEEDDEIVTLEEFLERWVPGTYVFTGKSDGGEKSAGETELTLNLPAAPIEIEFDGSVVSWGMGTHGDANAGLGNCANHGELHAMVDDGLLPTHPESVAIDQFEVVLEPELDDGDPLHGLKFTIRVAGDSAMEVTVPAEFLAHFDDDTLGKVEVGAIGGEDNATFTEEEICINEDEGCED
jgi:hypothetical protein